MDDRLADIAYHYERGGNRAKAIDYLTRAGVQIAQRSASPEAMQHFRRAADILKEMLAGQSRDSRELELQMAIGHTASAYQGEGSADAGKAFARAVELAIAQDDTQQKVRALRDLGGYHSARGDLRRASEVSQKLQECVREIRNPELKCLATHFIGHFALQMGELRKAEQFLGAAVEIAPRVLEGFRCHALVRRGIALMSLGFPDQALSLAREGLTLRDDASSRYTYPVVLWWAGILHMLRGELSPAEDLFHKSLNLATERGFPLFMALNTAYLGLLSALRGQPQAGLEQLRRGTKLAGAGLSMFTEEPQERVFGHVLALGYQLAGRPDEALAILIPAIEWTEQSGAEVELTEMYQLKGRLLVKSNSKEAEKSFRTSIEIARRHSAKSPELRATTHLARLLGKEGRRDEARTMLSEIYNWFTEGFGTADLKDAKALLDELSGSA
jgi:adenylate cyclase